jgi:uncharacterized phiE125 gp8 family phage protein
VLDASGTPIHFTNRLTVDALEEPIGVEVFKLGNRIFHADENDYVDACLRTARLTVEARTGRALITQTHTMTLDRAPACQRAILLPVSPVISVTSVTAYSPADAGSTVATSVYRLDTESAPARLVLRDGQEWPTELRPQNGLVIVYVAGYGDTASDITDDRLVHAVRLLAAHWYAQREPVVVGTTAQELPLSVAALIDPLKVPWL